jgi:hypothetical protein
MGILLSIGDAFGISFGKEANLQIKRNSAEVKINGVMALIFFRLHIGVR